MKKVISTLTAVTFALGLAAAAQAQTVKTPEKPEVKTEQTSPTTAAPKQEETKPGEKMQPAGKPEVKAGEKKEVKKATKKQVKKATPEKKAEPATPEKQ